MTHEFTEAVRHFLDQHPHPELSSLMTDAREAEGSESQETGRLLMLHAREATKDVVSPAADELRAAYERALPHAVVF